jgi:hypothetical protein
MCYLGFTVARQMSGSGCRRALQTRLLRGAARARIVGVMDGKSYTQRNVAVACMHAHRPGCEFLNEHCAHMLSQRPDTGLSTA